MKKLIFHPALLAFLLFSCGDARRERIEGVQRVMMHDVDEYSLMISEGSSVSVMRKFYANTVTFVRDVADDKPMWAEYYTDGGCRAGGSGDVLTVHLHGAAEVEGAGWNRGKGGQGRTNVVE
jgi:hypothetical protein